MERITSRSNQLLTHIRKLGTSRAYRREKGEYLCDGGKLLEEALRWSAPIAAVVCREGTALPPLPDGVRQVEVPADVLASVSPVETPQSLLFTVRMEGAEMPETLPGRRYLALEGVQDPGNVGTMIRTADAFDADGVLLLEGCADLYNPKTIRSTMGAVFRRPVYVCTLEDLTALAGRSGLPLWGAALREDTEDLRQADLRRGVILIGSEGRGLSAAALAACSRTVKIPMSGRCESLNAAVAAAVLLWEGYR